MMPFPLRRAPALLLPLLLTGLLPVSTQGQEEVIAVLRGEVRVGDEPFQNGSVILHQVSAEESGEIDSVRVDPDGSFQIRLPHVPDHATRPDIFFASVEYRGLLYFGPAITEAIQLDSLYLIQAFDTVSVPAGGAEIPLAARNLFLEKTAEGWMATDVLQLNQEGDRTLYSPEEGVVWSYPLPESATEFQTGQSDMAPEAMHFNGNRLEVFAPLPPGERYFMVRYRIPEDEFVLPLPGRTDRMELLIREPAPDSEFPPLTPTGPVELEQGNTFRRYAADNLVDTEIRSEMASKPWSLPPEFLGLFMAAVLGAAGVYGFRRRTRTRPAPVKAPTSSERDEVLFAIAELDEDFQKQMDPSQDERDAYEARRQSLIHHLRSHS